MSIGELSFVNCQGTSVVGSMELLSWSVEVRWMRGKVETQEEGSRSSHVLEKTVNLNMSEIL